MLGELFGDVRRATRVRQHATKPGDSLQITFDRSRPLTVGGHCFLQPGFGHVPGDALCRGYLLEGVEDDLVSDRDRRGLLCLAGRSTRHP